MAIVDTIPTLVVSRQPFEKPPQEQTIWSNIPRGFLHFALDGATLDAKPINDDQHLRISGVLPMGFAYQLVQIGMTIQQDVAASWQSRPIMRIVNWTSDTVAGVHLVFVLEDSFEFGDAAAVDPVTVLRGLGEAGSHPLAHQIMFQANRSNISFSLLAVNETDPAGAAGTIDFLISFLEFDLNQAVRFGLQTPAPVILR